MASGGTGKKIDSVIATIESAKTAYFVSAKRSVQR